MCLIGLTAIISIHIYESLIILLFLPQVIFLIIFYSMSKNKENTIIVKKSIYNTEFTTDIKSQAFLSV